MKRFIGLVSIVIVVNYIELQATTIHIPGDYPTIQQGIDAGSNGDTIMVAAGTYTGNGNRDIDFHGRSVLLISQFGPDSTIIDCQGSFPNPHRGFYFHSGEDSTSIVNGFTVTNGFQNGDGGGVYCFSSSPRIVNCYLTNNETDGSAGGFICWGTGSSPILENCVFSHNNSDSGGALASEDSDIRITGCTFFENSAYNRGGGVYLLESSFLIEDCLFDGNSSLYSQAGGVFIASCDSEMMRNCVIKDSHADYSGSGIHGIHSSLNMIDCSIFENSAQNYASAVFFEMRSYPILVNCSIYENFVRGITLYDSSSAIIYGCHIYGNATGGIEIISSSPLITNSVINDNAFTWYYDISSVSAAPVIMNSVVATTDPQGWGAFGGALSCTWNAHATVINSVIWAVNAPEEEDEVFVGDTSSVTITYSDIQGGWDGEGNIDINPLFRHPATGDYHLMSVACGDPNDSPCIDAGNPGIIDSLLDCSWGLGTNLSDMGAYGGGDSLRVGIEDPVDRPPSDLALFQNYPNPFNASTNIRFAISEPSDVAIEIYDILGRRIDVLLNGNRPAGSYSIIWNADDLASGVYFAGIRAGTGRQTVRMVLLK